MSNFIIGILLLSPVIVTIACFLFSIGDRQKRQVADRFPCTNCGHIIGSQAIDLADIKQREQPHLKLRLAPRIQAICTRCGTKFRYLEKDKIFKVEFDLSNN